MRLTRRALRQARAIPVRGRRTPRLPRLRRTPAAALLLSFLALLAPDLLRAPTLAGDGPTTATPAALRWLDEPNPAPSTPAVIRPDTPADRRVAGGAVGMAPLPGGAEETPVDAEAFARALDAARAHGDAYGVTFAAVRDGEVLWTGASGRARDGRTPLAAGSPMVIGSVTKTFVAAAVLRLVEEGRLELHDALVDHLPHVDDVAGTVTIAQLLDHTSGLADLFNDTTRGWLEDAPQRGRSAEEILDAVRDPWYEPGDGWAYANTNYFLLGMLVERLTGQPLDSVLTSRFLGPLALDGTRQLSGAAGDPLEAAWTTLFWASGAMASTAADLARWGDGLYAGDVLSAPTRTRMLTVNDHDYGLGAQRIEVGRLTGYGHTGLLNTYTTLLLHLPDDDVTVALLVNRSHVDLLGMLRADPAKGEPSLLDLARGLGRR